MKDFRISVYVCIISEDPEILQSREPITSVHIELIVDAFLEYLFYELFDFNQKHYTLHFYHYVHS